MGCVPMQPWLTLREILPGHLVERPQQSGRLGSSTDAVSGG
jgi:hypothetical protein